MSRLNLIFVEKEVVELIVVNDMEIESLEERELEELVSIVNVEVFNGAFVMDFVEDFVEDFIVDFKDNDEYLELDVLEVKVVVKFIIWKEDKRLWIIIDDEFAKDDIEVVGDIV